MTHNRYGYAFLEKAWEAVSFSQQAKGMQLSYKQKMKVFLTSGTGVL
ncbi:hypothetical protein Q5O89_23810 [Peribacillus frigoritolerans]|nr:hypothetical protein [Peribacillus frigoritolerans]